MAEKQHSKTYEITYEVLNSVTHGIGVIGAIVGAVFIYLGLSTHSHTAKTTVALAIYIISVMTFLLASTLFHALVFTKAKKVFQFFDHSGIYLVIIGSYTPYTWLFMPSQQGMIIWWLIVGLSAAGILYDLFFVGRWPWVSVIIYIVLGWLIIFALPSLHNSLSSAALWLLVAGGVTYSLGALVYLFPKLPMNHLYWHVFVLGGATFMYISIYISVF
ncbi:MAG: hemolysin III family protein [Lactobacillaceae bacterium]|jgi:hemolysin III|nr:hemolysin III family protein [Lactobacillaceae bacterium]